jgi:hypothetical protein
MKRDVDVLFVSRMSETDLQDELDLMRWETDGGALAPCRANRAETCAAAQAQADSRACKSRQAAHEGLLFTAGEEEREV